MKLSHFKVVTVALALAGLLPPFIFWVNSPHLSYMEVFLRFWPVWASALACQVALLVWEARRAGEEQDK